MIFFLRRFFAGCFLLLALAACSGVDILNAVVPHSGYKVHRDIAYGNNPRQHLDMYVPDAPNGGVIVFFYGGRWQHGSKDDYRFVAQAFASKGYMTVIPDYRLYPEIYFPEFMTDGANALAWVQTHIKAYGGDADRMFVAGHSAGAYIAVMLTVNDRYLKAAGGKRSWIKGAIGLAGPYDFLPFTDADIKTIFSKADDANTQPITFVSAHTPPVLLLTGDEDVDVYPKNTKHLAAKLESYHNSVTQHIYPGIAHMGIILALADGFRGKAPVLEDVDAFLQAHDPGRKQ